MQYTVTIRKPGQDDEVRTIEAPSRFVVYGEIQKEGGTVVDLAEAAAAFTLPAWAHLSFGSGVKRAVIARMARNLATMLTAGLSLSRALGAIQKESESKRLSAIAADLSTIVGKGSPFHEALATYPKVFPEFLVAMVKVGEESGSLADTLTIVGLQMERSDALAHKVRGALIYPAIVIIAIIIVSVLMLIYVVPTLTKTFTELHVELPRSTQLFVSLSDFLVAHSILMSIATLISIVGGITLLRSRPGHRVVIFISLRLPVIGELVRETFAARTARTLSSLLSAGVPVLEALTITRDVVNTPAYTAVIDTAAAQVKKGEPLSAAFADRPRLYPVLMSEMLAVGEETGKVAPMLKDVAEFYENNVSERTKDLSTIIEPALMLLIGGVVGIFAVSMIAPIYSLSSAI
jgi:type IV pilus assembly protein PilC